MEKIALRNQTTSDIEKTIKEVFVNNLEAEAIDCPIAAYGQVKDGTMRYCFGSNLEPKELTNTIYNSFTSIASVYMGWRQDVGTWATIYDFNGSKYSISISMKMPTTRDLMKNDPNASKYKTIIACYITK